MARVICVGAGVRQPARGLAGAVTPYLSLEGLREVHIVVEPNGQGGFEIVTAFPI